MRDPIKLYARLLENHIMVISGLFVVWGHHENFSYLGRFVVESGLYMALTRRVDPRAYAHTSTG